MANTVEQELVEALNFDFNNVGGLQTTFKIDAPLQQIFYGAPGTGKSHAVKDIVKGKDKDVIRTTFHPDSDYSTFVGAYKPVCESDKTKQFVYFDKSDGKAKSVDVYDVSGKIVPNDAITYKFIRQAFTKAYILAWEKLVNCDMISKQDKGDVTVTKDLSQLSYEYGKYIYTIVGVTDKEVVCEAKFKMGKNRFQKIWNKNKDWDSPKFEADNPSNSGITVQISLCRYIYENLFGGAAYETDFEEGWLRLINEINNKGKVTAVGPQQSYDVECIDDETLLFLCKRPSTKVILETYFNGKKKPSGIAIGILARLKEQDEENFEEAWTKLANVVNNKANKDVVETQDVEDALEDDDSGICATDMSQVYLIIEEINRGNCAQIFGDIFQLLDRGGSGFSEYPIEPDSDLQRELKAEFENNLIFADEIKGYINGLYKDDPAEDVAQKVKDGEYLILPCNLNLLATMNTSDQSLFPMDSAFKRRWDWKYVPINYDNSDSEFSIKLDDNHYYNWLKFLNRINGIIEQETHSEDKQMGNFFVKNEGQMIITADQFISKVMFYLWSEICKDNPKAKNRIFLYSTDKVLENGQKEREKFTFSNLFGDTKLDILNRFMDRLGIPNTIENSEPEVEGDGASSLNPDDKIDSFAFLDMAPGQTSGKLDEGAELTKRSPSKNEIYVSEMPIAIKRTAKYTKIIAWGEYAKIKDIRDNHGDEISNILGISNVDAQGYDKEGWKINNKTINIVVLQLTEGKTLDEQFAWIVEKTNQFIGIVKNYFQV